MQRAFEPSAVNGVDRLERAKSRPAIIEAAVRTALRDAIAWRIGGGDAPSPAALTTAAVAAARLTLDVTNGDSAERSRTLAAVAHAARAFAAGRFCRRLMTVPASRFIRLPRTFASPDVVVRDRRGHLHAIALSVRCDAFNAGAIAEDVARSTPVAAADRLMPLTVHVVSLATQQRHTFERDVLTNANAAAGRARVA